MKRASKAKRFIPPWRFRLSDAVERMRRKKFRIDALLVSADVWNFIDREYGNQHQLVRQFKLLSLEGIPIYESSIVQGDEILVVGKPL